ncbi:GNAT family N-acetyltransferase [Streptomyces sp. BI20]|uniref:GNAT family N-acetyltransferase n=1 Tax=Streptomyces sp. BI20 TaxID=3403460 RepID=UPI003C70D8F9
MKTSEAPHIRPARHDELDAVLAFWRDAAKGTSVSDDRAGMETLHARDPEALLLAFDGDTLAGTLIAGFDGWRCSLYRLAVHPAHRRRGIASALLATAEARFRALGGRRVDAMVLLDNPEGQGFWTEAGFERQTTWARWVKPLEG